MVLNNSHREGQERDVHFFHHCRKADALVGRDLTRHLNAAVVCFVSQLPSNTWPGMPAREAARMACPWYSTVCPLNNILNIQGGRLGDEKGDRHDQRHAPGPDVRLAQFWPRSSSTHRCQLFPKGLHRHVCTLSCLKILLLLQSMP
jgi:hypothetical protein